MYAANANRSHSQDDGSNVFGGANSIILDLGRQNLDTYYKQSEANFLSNYVPLVRDLRRYFRVDHNYVWTKLKVLGVPFLASKIVGYQLWGVGAVGGNASSSPAGTRSASANLSVVTSGGGVGGGYSFGDDMATPTSTTGGQQAAVSFGGSSGSPAPPTVSAAQPTLPPEPSPLDNVGAFDLYIPAMATLSYATLCGFVHGLQEDSLSPDYLASALWSITAWLVLEVAVTKIACWSLQLPMRVLDAVAVAGYKHANICALVLLRELIAGFLGDYVYIIIVMYGAAASIFFVFSTVGVMFARRDDGRTLRVPPRAKPVHYGWSIIQAPLVFWFAMRPL